MPSVALKIKSEKALSISNAQKQCLLHVLRNFALALNGAIYLVEKTDDKLDPDQLISCINNLPHNLKRVIDNLKHGSFCPLKPNECKFVGKFVGCGRSKPLKAYSKQTN